MPEEMTFARFVRLRRAELRLSQADLAWLARISRTTLSNLEHGRGDPESRTVTDVLVALGLDPSHLTDANFVKADRYAVIDDVLFQRILDLVIEERSHDDQNARRFADRMMLFLQSVRSGSTFEGSERHILMDFAGMVAPRLDLTSSVDQKILETFQDYGWNPDDVRDGPRIRRLSLGLGALMPTSGVALADTETAPALAEISAKLNDIAAQVEPFILGQRDSARAFERLPVVVQDVLLRGQIVDFDTHQPPNAPEITVVDLVVRDVRAVSAPLSSRKLTVEAVRRWSTILLAAKYLLENLAADQDPGEILDIVEHIVSERRARDSV
ncbi:helix-turn-helix domain-containing protein [Planotetraspora sp. GP83]|uniref:helix-turn-helix domain-containing protein n=1 Tax=Planotetraspora sp. GP83 TaxID=3156264 RepID=UPI003516F31C